MGSQLRFSLMLLFLSISVHIFAVQSKSGLQFFTFFLICSVIGFIFWILFTSSGRAYARKVDKDISESSLYSKSSLWESLTPEERAVRIQKTAHILKGLGIVFLIFVIIGLINIYNQPKSTQDPNRGCYYWVKKRICDGRRYPDI